MNIFELLGLILFSNIFLTAKLCSASLMDHTTYSPPLLRSKQIRPGDPPQHRKKILEVKSIVDTELGFATKQSNNSPHQQSLQDITSYLYISKKRVVGLLLVKRILHAYTLLPNNDNNDISNENDNATSKLHHSENQYSFSRSLKPSKALMGIHQIWCHHSHRHKGIASKLVDAARSTMVFGMTVPLELVAFSSPTLDGIRFAKKYLGTQRPLVYDIT